MRKKQFSGIVSLFACTFIWGTAFIAQSSGMDHVGPFTFQAIRCALAVTALVVAIWLSDKTRKVSFLRGWQDKQLWKAGILCGIPLFFAVNLQQVALQFTTVGKAGFLTAMYIVLVPILGLFLRRRFSVMAPVSVAIAVVGLYLLSFRGNVSINSGDLLLLGSALMFAIQILFVDHYAPGVDALRLNCLQAAVCAIGSVLVVPFTETVSFQGVLACWLPLCYAGVLSMGAAYSLQIIGQKHVEPTAASLIMSLEAVFSAIFGWLLLHESMSGQELLGCGLLFLAVILAQLPIPQKTESA